ncbi:MAG: glutamine synthetase [Rhodobacteraceae bacterium]|nr:glutamine synthetase [Paracoccaceae bacterium]
MTAGNQDLQDGALEARGLLTSDNLLKAAECIAQVKANKLKTVRILFADQHGILRGKTILAEAFASVFTAGICVPNTLLLKDTSHRTAFPVWTQDAAGLDAGAGDILLVPDPATFRILPWTDASAWIFCSAVSKSGAELPFSPRPLLAKAIDKLAATGRQLTVGLEVEFHVFDRVDDRLDHPAATMPGQPIETRNITQGYQFLTEQRFDQAEPVLEMLRHNAQALGLPVRSLEVEMGPSQFEFTFAPDDPMRHADNMMMFRAMVKETCARQGLHATFMCKPNVPNAAASGWHIHQSLCDTGGKNLMMPSSDGALSPDASAWIAGLLDHAEASCLLTTPTINGYKRYQPHQLAPDRILWGYDNRGAMIRAIMAADDRASRIENRVPEPSANPYYVFASQILSGLDGLERGLSAPDPVETPYQQDAKRLPENLLHAVEHFEKSDFYKNVLGQTFVDYLSEIRRSEWDRYHRTVSDWEQNEYFNLF